MSRPPPLRLVVSSGEGAEGSARPDPFPCAAVSTTHEDRVAFLSWATRQLGSRDPMQRAILDLWTLSAMASGE